MFDILKHFRIRRRTDKRGVTAVEYAVIAGVIVTTVAAAVTPLFNTLNTFFANLRL